jgi:hypothetical protein
MNYQSNEYITRSNGFLLLLSALYWHTHIVVIADYLPSAIKGRLYGDPGFNQKFILLKGGSMAGAKPAANELRRVRKLTTDHWRLFTEPDHLLLPVYLTEPD